MMGYGGIAGMGLFGPIGMAFWLVVVVVAIWGVSALFTGTSSPRRQEDPLAILQRRYASGEIDRAEYEEATQRLS